MINKLNLTLSVGLFFNSFVALAQTSGVPATNLQKFEAQERAKKLNQMVEDDSRNLKESRVKNEKDLIVSNGYFLQCNDAGTTSVTGLAFYNGSIFGFEYWKYNNRWGEINKVGNYNLKTRGPWSWGEFSTKMEFYPDSNILLYITLESTNYSAGEKKFSYQKKQCYHFAGKKPY